MTAGSYLAAVGPVTDWWSPTKYGRLSTAFLWRAGGLWGLRAATEASTWSHVEVNKNQDQTDHTTQEGSEASVKGLHLMFGVMHGHIDLMGCVIAEPPVDCNTQIDPRIPGLCLVDL